MHLRKSSILTFSFFLYLVIACKLTYAKVFTQKQIEKVVYSQCQNKEYSHQVAKAILKASAHYNVPVEAIIVTCIVESNFDMQSKPQLGIMQISHNTYREVYRPQGYNWRNVNDNIMMGTDYLSQGYNPRHSLRDMWYHYNPTSRGGYYRKALSTLKKINHDHFR